MKVIYIKSCKECPFGFFNKISILYSCKYKGHRFISIVDIQDSGMPDGCPLDDYEEGKDK